MTTHRCLITFEDESTKRYDPIDASNAYWAAFYTIRFWRCRYCKVDVYDSVTGAHQGTYQVAGTGRPVKVSPAKGKP